MAFLVERRQNWSRIVGLERRGAPLDTLFGRPLPDPTKLVDEDFREDQSHPRKMLGSRAKARPFRISGIDWVTKGASRTRIEISMLLRRKDARPR